MNDKLKLDQEHIKKFGVEPYVIGMYWSNPEEITRLIKKAIKTNKPYNEYELLTKEEQKDFDKGNLLF